MLLSFERPFVGAFAFVDQGPRCCTVMVWCGQSCRSRIGTCANGQCHDSSYGGYGPSKERIWDSTDQWPQPAACDVATAVWREAILRGGRLDSRCALAIPRGDQHFSPHSAGCGQPSAWRLWPSAVQRGTVVAVAGSEIGAKVGYNRPHGRRHADSLSDRAGGRLCRRAAPAAGLRRAAQTSRSARWHMKIPAKPCRRRH